MREPKHYLGVDLAGAKNQKTAVAALEYYPREGKIFLLDIHDRITQQRGHEHHPVGHQSTDEALLELLEELKPGVARIGVNVPLEFPPCVTCKRKTCPLPAKCGVPAVKWMREMNRKASRHHLKVLDFTPYTQRPIELWVRYMVLPRLHPHERFEIDETLGGNKAPLTARMSFLKRHLAGVQLSEVWPKLTVAILAHQFSLSKRATQVYRHLEQGIHAREEILEALADRGGVFIYERDVHKLAQNLPAFDAMICAYTALLRDLELTTETPAGFPLASGWVDYPRLEHR